MVLKTEIPRSSQDLLGKILSSWRNAVVAREIQPPFLDLACGDNRLARSMTGGVGVDVLNHGYADLLVQDLACLPFPSATFRSITIVASLSYFDDAESVLCECARVLKPGGILIVTLLNPVISKMWHHIREPWAKNPGITLARLIDLSNAAGLHIVRRSGFMLGINSMYFLSTSQ